MKTNEITDGNITLAEFMGHYNDLGAAIRFMYSSGEPFPLSGNDANFESVESEVQMEVEEFGSTLEIETVSFHNSWDWLMPVVEKILNICQESDEMEKYYVITDAIPEIEAVFSVCVKFAEWYKKQ